MQARRARLLVLQIEAISTGMKMVHRAAQRPKRDDKTCAHVLRVLRRLVRLAPQMIVSVENPFNKNWVNLDCVQATRLVTRMDDARHKLLQGGLSSAWTQGFGRARIPVCCCSMWRRTSVFRGVIMTVHTLCLVGANTRLFCAAILRTLKSRR